jgi:hypothetical protein
VTQGENKTKRESWSVTHREEEVARATLPIDSELREVSRTDQRAARRVSAPVLWGAALLGGTVALLALVRMARRRPTPQVVIRLSIEPRPRFSGLPIWGAAPVVGSALARLALRSFDAPASRQLTSAAGLVRTLVGTRHNNAVNGQREPLV